MKRYEPEIALPNSIPYMEECEHGDYVRYEDTLDALIEKIEQWGIDKGIIGPDGKATLGTQADKLMQECHEVNEEVCFGDIPKAQMEIGDVAVVSALMANMSGTDIKQCLQMAYDKISKRTGKMVNGTFVKDAP